MTNDGVPLPAPDSAEAPKYWNYETGGELVPAVHRLIERKPLSARDIALIREYCRQWIMSPVWGLNPTQDAAGAAALATLRATVDGLTTVAEIHRWLKLAEDEGIDPL
jgi:hypothetical protein